jgi:MOSC domain-containing protein YiiM
MSPRADHIESCRNKNCRTMAPQTEMMPARKVLRRPNARGWYCRPCGEGRLAFEEKIRQVRR